MWTTLLAFLARIEPFPDFRTLRGWAKSLGILLAAIEAVLLLLWAKNLTKHRSTMDQTFLYAAL